MEEYYHLYLAELKKIPPCTDRERMELAPRAAAGDEAARVRLIEGHLVLALAAARDCRDKGLPMSDLVQEANLALTMAAAEYQEGDFLAYARGRMTDFLEEALEEQAAETKTAKAVAARVNVLQDIAKDMAEELGREATVEELAGRMKLAPGEVKEIMKMAVDALSLTQEYGRALDIRGGIEGAGRYE